MSDAAGPSSSTAESGGEDIAVQAAKLLGQGRRNLLVGDAPGAVQVLQEACALLAAKYGDLADELGECYYHYGSALLELGRMESGVLGNALDGVPEEAADEDDDDEAVESAEKVQDEGAGPSTADEGTADEGTAEEGTGDEGTADEGTADEEKTDQEGEDGDDVSNFQLCWEILELARVVFSRQETKEFKLKVSQVHLKLGELGLETEQYSQSVDDFNLCLKMQEEHLEPESRLLAETHYNLGLAYGFDKKFAHAIKSFEAAKKVIESRKVKLEANIKENETKGKGKEKADADDPVVKDQKEIQELQELLPEIQAKLEDAQDMKKSAEDAASQAIAAAAAEFGLGSGASSESPFGAPSSTSSSSAPPAQMIQVRKAPAAASGTASSGTASSTSSVTATDISHLVRRKRDLPEEEASADDNKPDGASPTDSKRSKPDDSATTVDAGGDASTKPTNGHADTAADSSTDAKAKKLEKINGSAADAPAPAAMETS